MFETLSFNLCGFQNQDALCTLRAEDFHIANNESASSSMFAIGVGEHAKAWREGHFTETIILETTWLDDLILTDTLLDAVIIDTQAAELMVLQGVPRILELPSL